MLHGFVGRAGFEQHLDDVFVGAAVQRALERGDAGGGGGVNVGKRRGHDARGEGGGVQFVIGVQGERDVEGSLHHFVGLLAGEGVEEIRREAELRIAGDDILAVAQAVEGGDDGRGLRHQLDGLALALASGDMSLASGIVQATAWRRRCAAHPWAPTCRRCFKNAVTSAGIARLRDQMRLSARRVRPAWADALPQQENDFFKRGVFGQRMNVEALITQDSRIAIDVTNLRLSRDNSFKTRSL